MQAHLSRKIHCFHFYFQCVVRAIKNTLVLLFNTSKAAGKANQTQLFNQGIGLLFKLKKGAGTLLALSKACLANMHHVSPEWALEHTAYKFIVTVKWWVALWVILCGYHHVCLCAVMFPAWKNTLCGFILKSCAADVYIPSHILHLKRELFSHRHSSVHTRISEDIPHLNAISWVVWSITMVSAVGKPHGGASVTTAYRNAVKQSCDLCAIPFYQITLRVPAFRYQRGKSKSNPSCASSRGLELLWKSFSNVPVWF